MKAGLLRLPALCIAAVILLTFGSASADGLDVSAKGAVLIESRTGKVLYAKNAHEKLPMASTTKIMTALLAIENGNLNDIVETDASGHGLGAVLMQEHRPLAFYSHDSCFKPQGSE